MVSGAAVTSAETTFVVTTDHWPVKPATYSGIPIAATRASHTRKQSQSTSHATMRRHASGFTGLTVPRTAPLFRAIQVTSTE